MGQTKKKKEATRNDTLVGLLDAHLKSVIDALIGDGKISTADFTCITNASEKFINGVSAELLEVEMTPLLRIIRPDRYNAARKRRNGTGPNGNGDDRGGKSPKNIEYHPHQSPPDDHNNAGYDDYVSHAGDLFGEIDF